MTDKEAPVVVKGAAALAVGLFNGIQVTSGVLPPVSPLVSPTQRSCLLYTSPSPRDRTRYRMPSSA